MFPGGGVGGLQAPREETSLCAPKSVLSRTPKGRMNKTVHTNAAPQVPCTGASTRVKGAGSRPRPAPLLCENPGGRERGELPAAAGAPASTETQRSGQKSPSLEGPCRVFLVAPHLQLRLIP